MHKGKDRCFVALQIVVLHRLCMSPFKGPTLVPALVGGLRLPSIDSRTWLGVRVGGPFFYETCSECVHEHKG